MIDANCRVCGVPGCIEARGRDFHAGSYFGSKTCDYSGTPPFADAEWAGKNQDPADPMCEWCAGTGHPHADESFGMCECPPRGEGDAPRRSASVFVRLFKPKFAPLVENGEKLQTVRPTPKRMPQAGDRISLRAWEGMPYRSKQRILREATITKVEHVEITETGVAVNSMAAPCDDFARADGFVDFFELAEWFKSTHGLPFEGIIIHWNVPDEVSLLASGTKACSAGDVPEVPKAQGLTPSACSTYVFHHLVDKKTGAILASYGDLAHAKSAAIEMIKRGDPRPTISSRAETITEDRHATGHPSSQSTN